MVVHSKMRGSTCAALAVTAAGAVGLGFVAPQAKSIEKGRRTDPGQACFFLQTNYTAHSANTWRVQVRCLGKDIIQLGAMPNLQVPSSSMTRTSSASSTAPARSAASSARAVPSAAPVAVAGLGLLSLAGASARRSKKSKKSVVSLRARGGEEDTRVCIPLEECPYFLDVAQGFCLYFLHTEDQKRICKLNFLHYIVTQVGLWFGLRSGH